MTTFGAFLAFFLFGFADNLKSPALPALLDDLNLSYSLGGTIVLGSYLGFLIATLLTGPLCDVAGKKVFFLPLTGLFFSIVFPTITAAVSDLQQENVGTILGLLYTFAGIGGMLGPWTIGVFSDWLGIQTGFGVISVFCVAMSVIFGLLIGKRKRIWSS